MIGGGFQTCATTVVGNNIGRGDGVNAIKYFAATTVVAVPIFSVLCTYSFFHLRSILMRFTDIEEVYDLSPTINALFALNIMIDCLCAFLRGVIRALGLQNSLIIPHVFGQGVVSGMLTWYIAFEKGHGYEGIWEAKTIVSVYLLICYVRIIYKADWQ